MRTLFYLLLALVLPVAACTKAEEGPVDNLLGGRIRIIGHAGLGFESTLNPFPSNTLTSIRKLVEGYGADGAEMDVQMSLDSVPVLYHDHELESMTECSGLVRQNSFAAMQNCRYRTDFNSHILQDEKIISLENIVSRYAGTTYDPYLYLDIKLPISLEAPAYNHYNEAFMRAIHRIVQHYGQSHRVVASAALPGQLLLLRQHNPDLELLYDHNNFDEALQTVVDHNFQGIVIANDNISKEQVKEAHRLGKQVVLFSVALRSDIIEAVNKHPDVIQTDNIILLQQILTR